MRLAYLRVAHAVLQVVRCLLWDALSREMNTNMRSSGSNATRIFKRYLRSRIGNPMQGKAMREGFEGLQSQPFKQLPYLDAAALTCGVDWPNGHDRSRDLPWKRNRLCQRHIGSTVSAPPLFPRKRLQLKLDGNRKAVHILDTLPIGSCDMISDTNSLLRSASTPPAETGLSRSRIAES
ncbi:uncharacterized protein BDR25DRAFT_348444 [Lindgomyces ingoldianus]|uniref:Uncharacterized protein n=1 Tax=Lindgomyces ingoldianus TaxID=673940 RepID=A0ACB6RFY4_9PLEO|nr:uncharacterized protein BDR25DRAFT_348444 [Lindgomyces ingoldianus]KAF2478179.1 hypothetical protein BDR25DRAFT_348444 [Lindgomyces ingoldianus]